MAAVGSKTVQIRCKRSANVVQISCKSIQVDGDVETRGGAVTRVAPGPKLQIKKIALERVSALPASRCLMIK